MHDAALLEGENLMIFMYSCCFFSYPPPGSQFIFTGKSVKHGYGLIIELLSFALIGKLTQRNEQHNRCTSCGTRLSALTSLSDNGKINILRSSHLCIQALVKFAFHSEIWVCDSETLRFSPKQ